MKTQIVLAIAVLCGLAGAGQGLAESRLNVGVGMTKFIPTTPDGAHYQRAFAHDFDTLNVGGKVTYEYRFQSPWSVSAGYVHLGSVVASSDSVEDSEYDPSRHLCKKDCGDTTQYSARDTYHGLESFATYRVPEAGPVQPFVTFGLAFMRHTLKNKGGEGREVFIDHVVMWRAGAGVCYGWLCGDITYYTGGNVNDQFPISTQMILSTVYLSIPIDW